MLSRAGAGAAVQGRSRAPSEVSMTFLECNGVNLAQGLGDSLEGAHTVGSVGQRMK